MKQTCILVLGMHRSGTSALTGVLDLLDIYLGSELVSASTVENEKGFFENKKFLNINKALLSEAGSNWDDIFYNEEKLKNIKALEALKETLVKEFQYSNVFAIKDPRLAFLFPVYEKILKELDIDIKVILPYRNPLEVANSLQHRNDMSMEKGMLLWAYHFLLAEEYSRNYPRVFVDFDQLLNNTEVVVQDLSTHLDIDLDTPYNKNKKEIDSFLEADLKHHNISMDNLSEQTPSIVKEILRLRDRFNDESLIEEFDRLRHELFSYQRLFYNKEILTLTTLNTDLSRKLEDTKVRLDKSIADMQSKLQTAEKALQQQLEAHKEQIETYEAQAVTQEHALQQQLQAYKEQTAHLEQQHKELTNKNAAITALEEKLSDSKSLLDEKRLELHSKVSLIEERDRELVSQENTLERLEQAHQEKIKALQKSNKEQEHSFKALQRQYEQKSEELRHVRFELVSVYTGKSWRLTRPLRKLMKLLRKR